MFGREHDVLGRECYVPRHVDNHQRTATTTDMCKQIQSDR
jgi:hypothetical protein